MHMVLIEELRSRKILMKETISVFFNNDQKIIRSKVDNVLREKIRNLGGYTYAFDSVITCIFEFYGICVVDFDDIARL